MAGEGPDRDTDHPAGPSSPTNTPASRPFRLDLGSVLSKGLSLIDAVPAALLGFITIWLFALFPGLRPWTPPEERTVSISNAVVAERQFTRRDDREEVTVVTFEA